MQRITMTLDDDLMAEIDALIVSRGYQSRSEAIRDLARAGLHQAREEVSADRSCVAAVVYVYDHAKRELSRRLTDAFHAHHDLSVATMHVHLDHDACLEVTVLKGLVSEVRHVAEHVVAERGVEYGQVVVVPAELASERHEHGDGDPHSHPHVHVR